MRLSHLAAGFFLASLSLPLAAQTTATFPSELQGLTGGTVEGQWPLGYGISRTQAVLERIAMNIPNGRQISQLRLRQKEGYTLASRLLQVSIYMGGTDKTAATAGSDFLANYSNGTPRTLVFGPAVLTLPAFAASQSPAGQVLIPLTTPYTYNANENLVLEFVITANNNANQPFNYYVDAGYFTSPVTSFGTGCLTSANQIPLLTGTGGYYGSSVAFSLSRAPANSTLYFNLNLNPTTPLPGGPFGAPGCTLLDGQMAGFLSTAAGGSYNNSIPIPNDPGFYGLTLYGQAMIFDLFANQLGFAASNGVQIEVGRLPPMAKIYAAGSTATVGSVQRQTGPMIFFDHN